MRSLTTFTACCDDRQSQIPIGHSVQTHDANRHIHTITCDDKELIFWRNLMFNDLRITGDDLRLGANGGVLLVFEISQSAREGKVSCHNA